MNISVAYLLRSSALAGIALSAALVSSAAFAADAASPAAADAASPGPDASPDRGLTEIIVTAQKRATNLQDTPIAISVLGSEDLANRHVQSLLDLADGGIPSLRVAPFFSRKSALIMNIRGIGVMSDSNQPARDMGVGVYIDGVYMGRAQGLGTALYDIESIEVLKGPQGTLFGRNTEGGAVNITTRKPTGKFGLSATAGIGNYGSYKGEIHLNLPEFHNFSVKIDAITTQHDGFVKNPLAGQRDFNASEQRGLHAEVLWAPSSTFSADYSFDISYDASTPLYVQSITAGSYGRAPLQVLQPERASEAVIGTPQQPSIGKTHGHRLTLDWNPSTELEVKSITSYRELTQSQFDNGSVNLSVFAPNGNFARYSLAHFDQDQFSQEIQLVGELPRLKFMAGALYFHERVEDNAQSPNTLTWNADGTGYSIISIPDYTAVTIDRASHVRTDSYGAFGQATYTPALLDDRIHLTAGARWSRDEKKGELFIVNGATPTVNGVTAPQQLDAGWSRVDPLINLSIDASKDVHLYGKWSTGYRSGGANSRSLTYAPFNPETVSMFEIGAKTQFLDNKVRLNIAAYTASYKNIQVDFSALFQQMDANGNLITNNRTTTETANAQGKGRLKGLEADLTIAPVDGLTLNASYAYTSVRIPDTVNPFPQANGVYVDTPVKIYQVYTPAHAASGSIDYEIPMNGFTLRAHLDGNYDSGSYVSSTDPAAGIKQPKTDKGFVVNGRLGIADIDLGRSDAKLSLSVWSRNLFNEQHMFYKTYSPYLGTYGIFNDPRTWGVEANVKF